MSIVGFGALFELYPANFLMKYFWAVLFALAFLIAEFVAYLERRVAYYAARRSVQSICFVVCKGKFQDDELCN